MKKALTLVVGGLLVCGAVFAQTEREQPEFVPNTSLGITNNVPSSGLRLIDPSRLRNYNQMIFSVSSSGSDSFQGLYLSSLDYRLARPLDLSVTLGASFTPGGNWGDSSQGQFFLSSMSLRYQPSESTLIRFYYQDPRGLVPYYYANPLANRWWYRDR